MICLCANDWGFIMTNWWCGRNREEQCWLPKALSKCKIRCNTPTKCCALLLEGAIDVWEEQKISWLLTSIQPRGRTLYVVLETHFLKKFTKGKLDLCNFDFKCVVSRLLGSGNLSQGTRHLAINRFSPNKMSAQKFDQGVLLTRPRCVNRNRVPALLRRKPSPSYLMNNYRLPVRLCLQRGHLMMWAEQMDTDAVNIRLVEIFQQKKFPIPHIRSLSFILLIIFCAQLHGTALISIGLLTWTAAHWSNILFTELGLRLWHIQCGSARGQVLSATSLVVHQTGGIWRGCGTYGCFKSLYLNCSYSSVFKWLETPATTAARDRWGTV